MWGFVENVENVAVPYQGRGAYFLTSKNPSFSLHLNTINISILIPMGAKIPNPGFVLFVLFVRFFFPSTFLGGWKTLGT